MRYFGGRSLSTIKRLHLSTHHQGAETQTVGAYGAAAAYGRRAYGRRGVRRPCGRDAHTRVSAPLRPSGRRYDGALRAKGALAAGEPPGVRGRAQSAY